MVSAGCNAADKMEFLEYFLNGKKWAVIRFLLQGDSRDKTCGSVLEGGPEDMTIYGLTKRTGWMIRSEDFSVCERRTADDRWDRTVFRKIREILVVQKNLQLNFRQEKSPATGTYPRIPVRALFKSYNL